MRILIAEDDAVSRKMLEMQLRKWNHEVLTAEDGTRASELLQAEGAPRLVVLDWLMPGKDGVAVCREFRERSLAPYTYVIMLTGKDRKEDIVTALDAGADDFLTKPYNVEELRSRIGVGARTVALHEQLEESNRLLAQLARTDSLTQLLNRGAIMERLGVELERAHRTRRPMMVIMADVDHFKKVNDSYGHVVGDHVLVQVAERFRNASRGYDTVGRYGGEEFLTVIPEVPGEAVRAVGERFLHVISGSPMLVSQLSLSITASMGAISIGVDASYEVDSVVKAADALLYQAKAAGRNRVVFGSYPDKS